jgi:hypothetical protein
MEISSVVEAAEALETVNEATFGPWSIGDSFFSPLLGWSSQKFHHYAGEILDASSKENFSSIGSIIPSKHVLEGTIALPLHTIIISIFKDLDGVLMMSRLKST